LLAGAGVLGFISVPFVITGIIGWLTAIPVLAALALGAAGAADFLRTLAIPKQVIFDGQVIARWHEESESENTSSTVSYIAVDDGQRAWTFTGTELFSRVALGDLATVTVNPRSRTLIELTVTGRPRADAVTGREPETREPGARDQPPLLTLAEVTSVLGPVLRSTAIPSPGGRGVIHQGQGGTLSVVAAGGAVADLNLRLGRRGTPLSGIGDEAWLLSRGRCVIVRVGAQVAKVTVSGRGAAPAPLDRLAAAIAARLAEQDTRDPAPHPLR
jgi:hypothetical protein